MDQIFPIHLPIDDRTPTGIALAIGRLISTGALATGDKLPTVRAMAEQVGVSPTTVNDAWQILHSHGAITTEGRRGTFVRGTRQGTAPGRYWQVPVDPDIFSIDLSTGTPDPSLLPPLGPILSKLDLDAPVSSYLDAPVLPGLEALLRDAWPFEPEHLTIVDGAQDGLDRLITTLVSFGDAVVINDPAFPPILDMLDRAGAQTIPVEMDEDGVIPHALKEALLHDPVALFIQPRSHNPTGTTMTNKRAEQLAALVAERPITVVEDDHSAGISRATIATLGEFIPAQVVHIQSFSKSHGPDLRLAAVAGAGRPIDTLVRHRRLGSSWTSRLLQQVLLHMLTDNASKKIVSRAATEYARRRQALVESLDSHGLVVGGSSGINIWIPVIDEQFALISLAAHGIGAAPGTPFKVSPTAQQHIRVSTGQLADGIDEVGDLIARAATTNPRSSGAQSA